MRRNIDLTQNRDFSKRTHLHLLDFSKMFKTKIFPWSNALHPQVTSGEQELVFTGNRGDIQFKKKTHHWGKLCERCGYDGSQVPWNMIHGLCTVCNAIVDKEMKYKGDLVLGRFIHKIK